MSTDYKIQIRNARLGWYDVRSQYAFGQPWTVDLYATREDAQTAFDALHATTRERARIVTADTPEDWSPFA